MVEMGEKKKYSKAQYPAATAQWAQAPRTRCLGAKVEEEREEEEGEEGREGRRKGGEGRGRGQVRKSMPKKCTFDACQNTPPAHFRRRGPMKTCEHRVKIPNFFACGAPPRPRPFGPRPHQPKAGAAPGVHRLRHVHKSKYGHGGGCDGRPSPVPVRQAQWPSLHWAG